MMNNSTAVRAEITLWKSRSLPQGDTEDTLGKYFQLSGTMLCYLFLAGTVKSSNGWKTEERRKLKRRE